MTDSDRDADVVHIPTETLEGTHWTTAVRAELVKRAELRQRWVADAALSIFKMYNRPPADGPAESYRAIDCIRQAAKIWDHSILESSKTAKAKQSEYVDD